jgi:biopolymer transport protein ExbD
MSWRVRHEGSPRAVEGLTLPQVVQGLQDGAWDPTDEVCGPAESRWVAIENHPQLADVALDLEPPPPAHRPDETTLDMNPLIDVCLVLLIFFILTTTYAAMQKVLDMPALQANDVEKKLRVVKESEVQEYMIRVTARQEQGRPVIRVEESEVDPDNLVAVLSRYGKEKKKKIMLLDAVGVDWDTVIKIRDAAKGAGIQQVKLLVQPNEVGQEPPKLKR